MKICTDKSRQSLNIDGADSVVIGSRDQ